jgi:hypothetical protein
MVFLYSTTLDRRTSADMMSALLDKKRMIGLIKRRGNLSAPGPDGLMFPILKLEKDKAADVLRRMMLMMLRHNKCPEVWKKGKTILLHKGGGEQDSANWSPITLTSILYRILFGRLTQEILLIMNPKIGDSLFDKAQKGFVPGVSGCTEHIAQANMAMNIANSNRRGLYILAIDLKDAFGSVSHKLLENN